MKLEEEEFSSYHEVNSEHRLKGRCPECGSPHIFMRHGKSYARFGCRGCGRSGIFGAEICGHCYGDDLVETKEIWCTTFRCRDCEQRNELTSYSMAREEPGADEAMCPKCLEGHDELIVNG